MEPERPIEKVLRDAAKMRREQIGEDFVLHPATRRMLRDEATRQYKKGREGSSGSAAEIVPWWRSLGWSFGVFAGVLLAALLMWPREKHYQMAQANRSISQMERTGPAATPPSLAPAGAAAKLGLTENLAKARDKEAVPEEPAPASAPASSSVAWSAGAAPARPSADLALGPQKQELAKDLESRTSSNVLTNSAAPGFDDLGVASLADRPDNSRSTRLRAGEKGTFGSAVATRELQQPPAILTTFSFEQMGDLVKVVDADGSVYTGQVEVLLATTEGAIAGETEKKAARVINANRAPVATTGLAARKTSHPQNFYFAVRGTNETLKEPVSFSGRMVSATPADWLATNILAFSNATGTSTLTNATRVSGEAQIGGRSLKIEAVPAPRAATPPEK